MGRKVSCLPGPDTTDGLERFLLAWARRDPMVAAHRLSRHQLGMYSEAAILRAIGRDHPAKALILAEALEGEAGRARMQRFRLARQIEAHPEQAEALLPRLPLQPPAYRSALGYVGYVSRVRVAASAARAIGKRDLPHAVRLLERFIPEQDRLAPLLDLAADRIARDDPRALRLLDTAQALATGHAEPRKRADGQVAVAPIGWERSSAP